MIYVGIDIAKSKHDCCIMGIGAVILKDVFTIQNSSDGFSMLLECIRCFEQDTSAVRIGLESTGHYSLNLISFLRRSGFQPVIFNPLSVNLFRKAQTLRKTKTDKVDARFIAAMLLSRPDEVTMPVPQYIAELKTLTRSRYRLIRYRSRLKISLSRLLDIIFPELASVVWSNNQKSVYALLLEFPNPQTITGCHLTKLTNILRQASHGKYGREKALQIRDLASCSIGSNSPALAFELQQTIRLILSVQSEIILLDKQIRSIVEESHTPLLSIPGISYTLAAIIIAEIGDISCFSTPAKLLAFAGMDPSTSQSGRYTASNTPMVKRGSSYLRWAILQAARLVSMRDATFRQFMLKKRAEGKHHFVVMSHVGKKLIRVIFHMLQTGQAFSPQN